MPLIPGTRLGSYEILAAIGAGGMGEVYRARDTHLNRDVALKVLLDSIVGHPDPSTLRGPQGRREPRRTATRSGSSRARSRDERVARFTREAHVLASLNHPHIAHLYGFEAGAPTARLVMELVEGPTLADLIAAAPGGLPLDRALPTARQIAEALEAAHEHGMLRESRECPREYRANSP
jgi:serine/threonine protein kinase